jgi:arylsulfatase
MVHLDGYNQVDLITGKGPSARHEIFYLTETTLAVVRIDDYKYRFTDQPGGWLGAPRKWCFVASVHRGTGDGRGASRFGSSAGVATAASGPADVTLARAAASRLTTLAWREQPT